jgi:hypothetical protein
VVGIPASLEGHLPSGHLKLPTDKGGPDVYPADIERSAAELSDLAYDDHPWEDLDYPSDQEALEQGVAEEGIDFLAVYAPYTYWGRDWGIYFFINRIHEFARKLAREEPRLARSRWDLLDGLMSMIQAHEELHFRVELLAVQHRATSGFDHYALYSSRHSFTAPGSDAAEEAVATALELAHGRESDPELARSLARRTKDMPKGYRDHRKYRGEAGRYRGLALLAARALGRADTAARSVSTDLMDEAFADLYVRSVPRYWLVERALPPWMDPYLLGRRYRQLTLTDILRHAYKYAIVKRGGKHPWKVERNGRSVPLQDHPRINRSYPDHIVAQLASLFELSKSDYVEAVLAS